MADYRLRNLGRRLTLSICLAMGTCTAAHGSWVDRVKLIAGKCRLLIARVAPPNQPDSRVFESHSNTRAHTPIGVQSRATPRHLEIWRNSLEKLIHSRLSLFKTEFRDEISDDDASAILHRVYIQLFEDYSRSIESQEISAIFNLRKLKAWMAILGHRFTGDRQTKLTIIRGSSGISTVTGEAGSLIGLTIDGKLRPDQVSAGLGNLIADVNKMRGSTLVESLGRLRYDFEMIHPFMDFPKTITFLMLDFCLLRMGKNPPLSGIGEPKVLLYYSDL